MKSNNQNQNNPQNNDENNPVPESRGPRINIIAIIGVLFGVFIAQQLFFPLESSNTKEISEQEFLRKILPSHDVAKIQIVNKERVEVFIKADSLANPEYQDVRPANATRFNEKNPQYYFTIASAENFDADLRDAQRSFDPNQIINAKNVSRTNWMVEILQYLLPIFIVVAIWIFLMRRMSGGVGGAGGQIFNFGKSKATLFDGDSRVNITFNDVAGLDEAKEEVLEVVDFLRNPKKYTALGGKIPKGVLLIGPPGTGKTLLAKAVAGEAKVPFFSISGSDFVEMFVGVGASRVRDLFKQAREKAPCIIFIDEIDAIGRARGRNMIQSNDERENTLNALLVEMDGFGSEKGVIIIAATNRPDVLDSALMRPGRFDRQISVDKPDLVGREAIFKVHLLPIILADDVDVKRLAAQTPGFAGAEIANVCNEAALIAARRNKSAVEMQDFHDAIDRVIGGLEKKNKIISPEEKEIIA